MKTKTATAKGFTLIELLVVISIIGLLSVIVMVAVNSARRGAEASKVQSDFRQIRQAFNIWMSDTGITLLPRQNDYDIIAAVCGNDEPPISATDLFINASSLPGWSGPYLGTIPKTPWGAEYTYDNDGDQWPTYGSSSGVNLMLQYCNSSNGRRAQALAARIDRNVDNGDGRSSGQIRWSSSSSSGTVRILIAPLGD